MVHWGGGYLVSSKKNCLMLCFKVAIWRHRLCWQWQCMVSSGFRKVTPERFLPSSKTLRWRACEKLGLIYAFEGIWIPTHPPVKVLEGSCERMGGLRSPLAPGVIKGGTWCFKLICLIVCPCCPWQLFKNFWLPIQKTYLGSLRLKIQIKPIVLSDFLTSILAKKPKRNNELLLAFDDC